MKNPKLSLLTMSLISGLLLTASGPALAANGAPMTPEMAAKKETHRKQEEQRITPEKRKAAVQALKAERLKVHQARQAVQQGTPVIIESK